MTKFILYSLLTVDLGYHASVWSAGLS